MTYLKFRMPAFILNHFVKFFVNGRGGRGGETSNWRVIKMYTLFGITDLTSSNSFWFTSTICFWTDTGSSSFTFLSGFLICWCFCLWLSSLARSFCSFPPVHDLSSCPLPALWFFFFFSLFPLLLPCSTPQKISLRIFHLLLIGCVCSSYLRLTSSEINCINIFLIQIENYFGRNSFFLKCLNSSVWWQYTTAGLNDRSVLVFRILFFFATLQKKRLNVADPVLLLSLIRSVYEIPHALWLVCFAHNLYFVY